MALDRCPSSPSRGRNALKLAVFILLASTGLVLAAEPTKDDYRLLQSDYGLARDSDVLAGLNQNERTRLHDLLHGLKRDKAGRDDAVRGLLYEAYARECDAWAQRHPGEACRPASDPAARPGKEIADRLCNECHLFGSGMAPSFFQVAKRRPWDADALAQALQHSHDMVPVTLPADERDKLAAYIKSFR